MSEDELLTNQERILANQEEIMTRLGK